MASSESISKMQEAEGKPFKRSTTRQVSLALITNFTNIAPSMSLGFSAVALPALPFLTPSSASWFASIAPLATPLGCLLSGPIADRLGRRPALHVTNATALLGWLTLALASLLPPASRLLLPLLLLGRLLTGLATGLASVPATVYMAEVATAPLRSIFCTWASLFFAVGVLAVYALGWLLTPNWGLMALLAAGLPIAATALVCAFMPESPAWLVRKRRVEEARRALHRINGAGCPGAYVDRQIDELERTVDAKQVAKYESKPLVEQFGRKVRQLTKRNCLRPLGLVLVFFFFQQFAGTFVIVFYAIDIVKGAGIEFDPYLAIVLIGVVRLLAAILLSCISKRFGRRALSLVSGAGMALTMITLGAYIQLENGAQIAGWSLLPVALLLAYFLVSTVGFLAQPFALAAELVPAKVRGTASGVASAFGYLCNFATVKTYPQMAAALGAGGVFFFYGAMALAGTAFVWGWVPETRGKTLAEIGAMFERKAAKRSSLLKVEPAV